MRLFGREGAISIYRAIERLADNPEEIIFPHGGSEGFSSFWFISADGREYHIGVSFDRDEEEGQDPGLYVRMIYPINEWWPD